MLKTALNTIELILNYADTNITTFNWINHIFYYFT